MSEEVICALLRDFRQHGQKAIAQVRMRQPAAYLKVLALLVPRSQNVNFAIQPSIVMNFLAVKGVIANYASSTGAQKPPSEVADIAKKFTIHVSCQGIFPKTATGSAGPLVFSPSDVTDFGNKFNVEATPGRGSTRP